MPDDEQSQNSAETQSEETTDKSLDSWLGGDAGKNEQTETQTTENATEKEEKKQRDFERAFFKANEENKTLKEQLRVAQSTNAPIKPAETLEDEGINLLKSVVRDAVSEERDRALAVQEIREKPYFDVLQPKILEIAKDLPEGMTDRQRLETAYERATAQNVDLIVQTALKVGQEAGYKNRQFKTAQGSMGVRETAKISGQKNDQMERYQKGELSNEEYKELRDDGTLEQWDRQELGLE